MQHNTYGSGHIFTLYYIGCGFIIIFGGVVVAFFFFSFFLSLTCDRNKNDQTVPSHSHIKQGQHYKCQTGSRAPVATTAATRISSLVVCVDRDALEWWDEKKSVIWRAKEGGWKEDSHLIMARSKMEVGRKEEVKQRNGENPSEEVEEEEEDTSTTADHQTNVCGAQVLCPDVYGSGGDIKRERERERKLVVDTKLHLPHFHTNKKQKTQCFYY